MDHPSFTIPLIYNRYIMDIIPQNTSPRNQEGRAEKSNFTKSFIHVKNSFISTSGWPESKSNNLLLEEHHDGNKIIKQ